MSDLTPVVAAERDDGVVVIECPDDLGIRYRAVHPDGRTLGPYSLEDAMYEADVRWESRAPSEARPIVTAPDGGRRTLRRPLPRKSRGVEKPE